MNTCKSLITKTLNIIKKCPQKIAEMHKALAPIVKKQATASAGACKKLCSVLQNKMTEKAKQFFLSGVVVAGAVTAVVIVFSCTCSIGTEISVGDQVIGVAKNAAVYDVLLEKINHEVGYVIDGGFTPVAEPSFSTRLIVKNGFTSEAEMAERLKATGTDMIPAYGVLVDGELVFALPNKDMALSVLTDYKNSFLTDSINGTASFCQNVAVTHCFVPKTALKTKESATSALQKGRIEMYHPSEGESLDNICAQFNITIDDLLQNNIIADVEKTATGVLSIPTGMPLISVKTQQALTIEEVLPRNTVETEDASLYEGSIVVKQEGADGLKVIEAIVTSVNGIETERDVLSENLISASVDHIVCKGTKKLPKATAGGMAIPASGTLTSRFGSRWGRNHNGIDMSAPVGTAIFAADSGTVTYSEYNNGGFGYLMKIDHGNGLETYYAHCSELLVPEGTVVKKGDLIARVGNTGRSTGAHLHFEVHLDGTPIDPLTYLAGLK
ncbi:MAG: M23 family metallopeptidase [Ruminococcaceae bacterium]|nr:M23 family metallopeptidase [Oscillospiraceae bacterium]